ncbi:Forkhead-associated (FHA) protein [Erwinia billingiae Eb661]|uniref:Forkhead-associated (FHA) protein n=1 Tax=Erwinia billingiae (strain Eb661) TaxID=634500 RepID=D8MMR2_ERWBE|nr:type VI secretion system-associated FHA domain protein TagH [Erwinia billingiae]CAX58119.1 Forkhead-associated (FHA) protein [Erwinia billingiae Eb661]
MRFTIIATKSGQQPPQGSCDFMPPGGTIGRGTENNLVLPDENRSISRLQAIVHVSANGECQITNRGTVTLVHLNDIPLQRGRQVELQDGDIIRIDDYALQVSELGAGAQPIVSAPIARAVVSDAPASAQASPQHVSSPSAAPNAASQPVPPNTAPQAAAAPSATAHAAQPPVSTQAASANTVIPQPQPSAPQPAAKENSPAAIPSEIWDSLAQEFSISDSLSNRSKPQPANLNPFAEAPAPDRNPVDPLAQFASKPDSLNFDRRDQTPDSLFTDDDGLFKQDSIFNDSTPSTLMQQPAAQPQQPGKGKDELDPLALFGGSGGGAPAQANSDDPLGLMMGNAVPLTPMDASGSQPRPATQQPPQHTIVPPAPHALDSDFDLFAGDKSNTQHASPLFDDAPQHGDETPSRSADSPADLADSPLFDQPPTAAQPDYGGITLPTPQAVARNTTPPPKGRLRIDPVSNTASQQSSSSASSGQVLDGELLDALIGGMGLNDLQPTPRIDRDSMQELGQMLSMFSQGTVALLSSRSILKRGVKAEMTVILDEANNPFKLLPSGKSVLMQMFGSRMPGFMPPKQSVRDALVDLQAHQLGMIAGIRAIIASMLQSFNPQQLEEEAKQEGITSRISLPSSRKAALWEHFTKRYGETAGEIEDDFHTLFGEAFLHAYDMEVNQYKDSQIRSEE